MSIWGRKVSRKVVAAVAALLIVGALLPVWTKTPSREVTLIARGMAFYLEGDPETPNPVITVRAGETVRIVLRNNDRGMTHDFAVPSLDAELDLVDWNEQADVTFDAPKRPGTYEYECRPHRLMMKGRMVVEP